MQKQTSSISNKGVFMVLLCAALGLGALATYVTSTPSATHVPPELRKTPVAPTPSTVQNTDKPSAAPIATEEPTSLRPPLINGQMVSLGASEPIPYGTKPAVFAANEALRAAHVIEARALGVDLQNGVALIDFNSAIRDGVGSEQEASFIEAMQRALGQIPTIQKFLITVEGKPIDSLGHFEISTPIDVIRPDQASASTKPFGE